MYEESLKKDVNIFEHLLQLLKTEEINQEDLTDERKNELEDLLNLF